MNIAAVLTALGALGGLTSLLALIAGAFPARSSYLMRNLERSGLILKDLTQGTAEYDKTARVVSLYADYLVEIEIVNTAVGLARARARLFIIVGAVYVLGSLAIIVNEAQSGESSSALPGLAFMFGVGLAVVGIAMNLRTGDKIRAAQNKVKPAPLSPAPQNPVAPVSPVGGSGPTPVGESGSAPTGTSAAS